MRGNTPRVQIHKAEGAGHTSAKQLTIGARPVIKTLASPTSMCCSATMLRTCSMTRSWSPLKRHDFRKPAWTRGRRRSHGLPRFGGCTTGQACEQHAGQCHYLTSTLPESHCGANCTLIASVAIDISVITTVESKRIWCEMQPL